MDYHLKYNFTYLQIFNVLKFEFPLKFICYKLFLQMCSIWYLLLICYSFFMVCILASISFKPDNFQTNSSTETRNS